MKQAIDIMVPTFGITLHSPNMQYAVPKDLPGWESSIIYPFVNSLCNMLP